MRQQTPRRLTICIDGNEQNKLRFPETIFIGRGNQTTLVEIAKREFRFDTGDYYLDGFQDVCIAERKGSLTELHQNLCTRDNDRFRKAITRMVKATRIPILWLDIPYSDLWTPTEYVEDPHDVIDKMLRTVREFNLQLVWVPPATTASKAHRSGEFLIRTMWSFIRYERSRPPDLSQLLEEPACQ